MTRSRRRQGAPEPDEDAAVAGHLEHLQGLERVIEAALDELRATLEQTRRLMEQARARRLRGRTDDSSESDG